MSDPKAEPRQPEREPRSRKKAYRAPRILSEEKIEVVASTCTGPGAKDSPATCSLGPIAS